VRFDYINPFADSACETLSRILHAPVQKGELSLKNSPVPNLGVATIIGITGQVKGRVIFEMEPRTALELAEALNGEHLEKMTPLALDTIAEMSNMMIGGAVTALNNQGFEFNVTPPTIFSGVEMASADIHMETLVIPLETSYGKVIVNAALQID